MLAIRIRKARSGDWAQLETLIAGICREHGDKHAMTRKDFDRMVCIENAPVTVLVAETPEGVLIGYVAGYSIYEFSMGRTNFNIENLYVAEGFRRQRVGESLMISIMQEVRKQQDEIRFKIGAWDENTAALSLYKQLGFSETTHSKKTTRLTRM